MSVCVLSFDFNKLYFCASTTANSQTLIDVQNETLKGLRQPIVTEQFVQQFIFVKRDMRHQRTVISALYDVNEMHADLINRNRP